MRKVVAKRTADSLTKRLTDTSKYTAAHKHRFDKNGVGRAAAGRRDVEQEQALAKVFVLRAPVPAGEPSPPPPDGQVFNAFPAMERATRKDREKREKYERKRLKEEQSRVQAEEEEIGM